MHSGLGFPARWPNFSSFRPNGFCGLPFFYALIWGVLGPGVEDLLVEGPPVTAAWSCWTLMLLWERSRTSKAWTRNTRGLALAALGLGH